MKVVKNLMEILIDDRQKVKKLDKEIIKLIEDAVKECLIEESFDLNVELSLSFVDNEEIRYLNKTYRKKDYETDVLSFPMNEEIEDLIILGDIIISIDKVIEQAKDYEHSFERELIYLIIHGMFHLLGYDHIKEVDKKMMRLKEKKIIKKLELYR